MKTPKFFLAFFSLAAVVIGYSRPVIVSNAHEAPVYVWITSSDGLSDYVSFMLPYGHTLTVEAPHDSAGIGCSDLASGQTGFAPLGGSSLDVVSVTISESSPTELFVTVWTASRWKDLGEVFWFGFVSGIVFEVVGLMVRLLRNVPAHRGGEV